MMRPVLRAAGLLALAPAVLAVTSAAASTAGVGAAAHAQAGPAQKAVWTFSCDLSAYGEAGDSTVQVTQSFPRAATTAVPATATLSVPVLLLPASVSQQMSAVTTFTVTSGGTDAGEVSGATVSEPSYQGTAAPAAGAPASIPAITASAAVTFVKPGEYSFSNVNAFMITPYAGGKALSPITCGAGMQSAAAYDVFVTAPGQPMSPGPLYICEYSTAGTPGGASPYPMTLSTSGAPTTGSTDKVTLTMESPYSQGTTAAVFTGSLSVSGAQQGSIPLSTNQADVTSPDVSLSGFLRLTRPGTDRISFPARFGFVMYGPANAPPPATTTFLCVMAPNPAQTWINLNVTGSSSSSSTPAAGSGGQGGGTTATGAVPAGAPNTGGGPRPASDLPAVLGGAALLLTGGSLLYLAKRRRQDRPA